MGRERTSGDLGTLGVKAKVLKLLMLFVAWIIAPVILLGFFEMALRLADYGRSTQLFIPREVNGETVFVTNRDFYQQFYTAPMGLVSRKLALAEAKPSNEYRVFVFGESAAEGVPDPDFSFARILDTMLRADNPDKQIKVCNMAMAGANSHVMYPAAKACVEMQPDLFVVYMGNNELNGLVTQSLLWDKVPPALGLFLVRANVALGDLRLSQFVRNILAQGDPSAGMGRPNPILDYERAYQYFDENLNDMCAVASDAGVPVILCTVGSRLWEWPPSGEHTKELSAEDLTAWQVALDAGNALAAQGRHGEALREYEKAAKINADHADLAYQIGACHYALGEYEKARLELVRARELDSIRFRPGKRIDDLIRGAVNAHASDGVALSETAQALAESSPHGIEGPEFFFDSVHLTFEGNHVLASSVLETLQTLEAKTSGVGAAPLSVEECRERLAFTLADYRDQILRTLKSDELVSKPPQPAYKKRLEQVESQILTSGEAMRLEGLQRGLSLDPASAHTRLRYINRLMIKREMSLALEQARILVEQHPFDRDGHSVMAQLSALSGDKDRAIEELRIVEAMEPHEPSTYLGLGIFLEEKNDLAGAEESYRKALKLQPSGAAEQGLGRTLAKLGDAGGAVDAYRRARVLEPQNEGVFRELFELLTKQGDDEAAQRELESWRASGKELPAGLPGLGAEGQ
jgi:Flp pilus assembly protein TadD